MGTPKFNLVLCFSITFMVFLYSCHSEIGEEPLSGTRVTTEEVATTIGIMEEIDWIVLSIMQRELGQFKIIPLLDAGNCPGAVINRNEEQKTIWVDFGEGCVSDRGVEKKGRMLIHYSDQLLQKGAKINLVFDSFYLNGFRMNGSRKVENLGYQAGNKSIRFVSQMENFQITNSNNREMNLTQSYVRDVKFSNEVMGFSIKLSGGGQLEMIDAPHLTIKIKQPLIYKQECMLWGISVPVEGLLELTPQGEKSVSLEYKGEGC